MYRIVVQGQIGERWASWFDDLTILAEAPPGEDARTVLSGPVPDQAALLGLLQKLYTLGLTLLLVERIDSAASQSGAAV